MGFKVFTAHALPDEMRRGVHAEVVFIPEAFSWPAAAFASVWALWLGLWEAALVLALPWVLVPIAIGIVLNVGASGNAVLIAAAMVLAGHGANDLWRWGLHRRGYVFLGVVTGRSRAEADRRLRDRLSDQHITESIQ